MHSKNIIMEKNSNLPIKTKQKNIIKSGNKYTIYLFYVQFYKKR